MAIADIFEAVTSIDRRYRNRPNTLSEALKILEGLKQRGHIDPDIFEVFIKHKVYLRYAKQFIKHDELIDCD